MDTEKLLKWMLEKQQQGLVWPQTAAQWQQRLIWKLVIQEVAAPLGNQRYGTWSIGDTPLFPAGLSVQLTKMGHGDDPEAFLVTFEWVATVACGPPERWATLIAPYLTSPAQAA